jgi:hypothetical protein
MRLVTWNRNGIHLTFLQDMSCTATSNARATGDRAGVSMTNRWSFEALATALGRWSRR